MKIARATPEDINALTDKQGATITKQFKLGDIVWFNPAKQMGIVVEINEERMKVDFFLDNEDGYAPKSFWDCFELIRAADNHPDTERLDFVEKIINIDGMVKREMGKGWVLFAEYDLSEPKPLLRDAIDAAMQAQATEAEAT